MDGKGKKRLRHTAQISRSWAGVRTIRELVDDLRTGCPTEILEWGIGNEVLTLWSTAETQGPVSPNRKLMVLG